MVATVFPIELERVIFTRSVVVSIQGHDPTVTKELAGPDNDINVSPIEGENNLFMATMTTKMNLDGSPEYPYMIDMECLGFFRVVDEADEKARNGGLLVVAHSVLYGAIREAVSWLTARQAYGSVSLGLSVLQPKK